MLAFVCLQVPQVPKREHRKMAAKEFYIIVSLCCMQYRVEPYKMSHDKTGRRNY